MVANTFWEEDGNTSIFSLSFLMSSQSAMEENEVYKSLEAKIKRLEQEVSLNDQKQDGGMIHTTSLLRVVLSPALITISHSLLCIAVHHSYWDKWAESMSEEDREKLKAVIGTCKQTLKVGSMTYVSSSRTAEVIWKVWSFYPLLPLFPSLHTLPSPPLHPHHQHANILQSRLDKPTSSGSSSSKTYSFIHITAIPHIFISVCHPGRFSKARMISVVVCEHRG